jgi:hypothetical protein
MYVEKHLCPGRVDLWNSLRLWRLEFEIVTSSPTRVICRVLVEITTLQSLCLLSPERFLENDLNVSKHLRVSSPNLGT